MRDDGSHVLATPNDGDDLRRFVRGDAGAFASLLQRHQAALLRYAGHLLGPGDAAEDAVQETFLRLLREAQSLVQHESFVTTGQLAPWLFRVCRNLCADVQRKEVRMHQRHQRVAVPDIDEPGPGAFEVEEERGKVRQLLDQLPEREREILVLKVFEGKSFREIQALQGVTLHEVFTTAHRALRRLADGLRAAGLA
jgi:RNA polymerase sigma-70 factor (ECF subfamily)